MSARTICTLAAAAAFMLTPAVAQAPAVAVAGVDDLTTSINEGATLDASRTVFVGEEALSAVDIVNQYAAMHGMTSCRAPRDAELDDVFLTLPVGPDGLPYLHIAHVDEVDLDTALDSAGKRIVYLACDTTTEGV